MMIIKVVIKIFLLPSAYKENSIDKPMNKLHNEVNLVKINNSKISRKYLDKSLTLYTHCVSFVMFMQKIAPYKRSWHNC